MDSCDAAHGCRSRPWPTAAVADAPSVRRVLVVRRAGAALATPWDDGRDAWWDTPVPGEADAAVGGDVDPETPYLLIYTSGTTGRPKGAVHVHGGFPIKAAQDLAHQFDLGPGDTLFWFTDLGWMMGPWAISGSLMLGARLVLYEGAPDFPGPDRLWALVERHRVTHLGLSPTVIRASMAHGEAPVRSHDRSSLRVLGSTGEPWNPDPWWWYFREVGEGRCPIVNYSGGTEVSGGIVSGNVVGPIKPASFSGPCIGTAADVVDGWQVRSVAASRGARHPCADAGHDPRVLARPGPLRGDVLVADPRDVGPRRLGEHRRRRVLVHPRPLRRHAQGRRQARGPGRGGERGRLASRPCWRPPRSASRTRSRARWSSCCASSARARPTTTSCATSVATDGRGPARQAAQARGRGGRPGPAQDPVRQGHAPGGAGGLAGPRPGRHLDARRSDDARGDPRGGVGSDAVALTDEFSRVSRSTVM